MGGFYLTTRFVILALLLQRRDLSLRENQAFGRDFLFLRPEA